MSPTVGKAFVTVGTSHLNLKSNVAKKKNNLFGKLLHLLLLLRHQPQTLLHWWWPHLRHLARRLRCRRPQLLSWPSNEFNDINKNHVILDLNSVILTEVSDLRTLGVDLKSGDTVNTWIDYDGNAKGLRIVTASAFVLALFAGALILVYSKKVKRMKRCKQLNSNGNCIENSQQS
ncbi:L-type lectin-domain containing receptor kinase VIII.2 [Spatholobus suberectus]|nr:L-type lectin-domain containing receptor kinase VIII.2 [Spatholobus suberectus]